MGWWCVESIGEPEMTAVQEFTLLLSSDKVGGPLQLEFFFFFFGA